jgi:hypothetical protein
MGRGLVSACSAVRVDVNDGGHGNLKGVVELMFDVVGSVMSNGHRHLGIDRDGGGNLELVAQPADLQICDIPHAIDREDDSLRFVDQFGFDSVEEPSCHHSSRANQ